MKKYFLLLFSVALVFTTSHASKRALIIAIGGYGESTNSDWPSISSVRDAGLISDALQKQDFPKDNIATLTDAAATTDGISAALDKLRDQCRPGDVVFIHVSSHGAQVQDDNGDEDDLLDECIVTYNAKHEMAPGGARNESVRSTTVSSELKNYYRDDLFGQKLEIIRERLGQDGDILVLMDLCHAGSITRGWEEGKKRGGEPPIIFKDFKELQAAAANGGKTISETQFREVPRGSGENGKATYVVISAARADEVDFETNDESGAGMGTLTYAACQALANMPLHTTYRGLFAAIETVIVEKKGGGQHPVIEGTGLNRELWGGRIVEQKAYLTIKSIGEDRSTIMVSGGTINGLDKGAKVVIYPVGTAQADGRNVLATGTVTSATVANSSIALDKPLSKIKQAPEAIVFITQKAYNVKPIVLGFDQFYPTADAAAVRQALSNFTLVSFSGTPELRLKGGAEKDSLFRTGGEAFFALAAKPAQNADKLQGLIENYAQYRVLEPLQQDEPEARVRVKLVPIINGKADTGNIAPIVYRKCTDRSCSESGYAIPAGMHIKLWIQNDSKQPLYVNVLDMQPDGIINGLLPIHAPTITVEPQDMRIPSGEGRMYPPGDRQWISISPPLGTERFKIFAMADEGGLGIPLDLEGIATTRGLCGNRGASDNALQHLLRSTYGMRGAGMMALPANTKVSISDCVFEIIKPDLR